VSSVHDSYMTGSRQINSGLRDRVAIWRIYRLTWNKSSEARTARG
jgi:hypothetical protein